MNEERNEGMEIEQRRLDSFRAGETVGEVLLASRERAGLSLEDASRATRIAKSMLEYLETDNFDAIPAKVYVKGFLRSYASVLDLDVEYILNKYE
ncbi:MAG: helix-turn-helix domain-containing protein, partial [Candidatus Krumholzibacteria bacterium]|nr:helix-turn-helix domain-containing protein [Candidatus Krumholzibacteria bacterium]